MIYIIDAQLPKKLSTWLKDGGFDSIHTLDLPDQNDTEDLEIIRISTETENSVIVSKDKDFPDYRIIKGLPQRLLWVTTGNITNTRLLELFEKAFSQIHTEFESGKLFVELSNDSIIVHE